MDIQQKVRDLLAGGMTQDQIGKAVGVSQSTISGITTGKAWAKRPPLMPALALERLWKQRRRTKRSRAA